ncbi:hypothetical protein L284_04310 [Novosphingobium lindaniclasticum LE124]|uniref:Uncharacterized protein n=1 Tax=Novosphingobium lindaniclasticum LE124 TaxID=1096930 RepID=T0HQ85_9SPHN|nr:hypothetical protein L284_04310 [Novosphingobium lindaniclasticum LE124]
MTGGSQPKRTFGGGEGIGSAQARAPLAAVRAERVGIARAAHNHPEA